MFAERRPCTGVGEPGIGAVMELRPGTLLLIVIAFCLGGFSGYFLGAEHGDQPGSSPPRIAEQTTEPAEASTPEPIATAPQPSAAAQETFEEGDSIAHPVPLGKKARIGPWELRVTSVEPDATAEITGTNPFNDPPRSGRQFFMVGVAATFKGRGKGVVWTDLTMLSLGRSAVAYQPFGNATCGVIPRPIDDEGDVYPGGTARGNVCWSVKKGDVRSLVMVVEWGFEEQAAFFALH